MADAEYEPFAGGPHQVDVRTIVATDQARGRLFPIEVWSPTQSGLRPLIVFSHYSGGHRRTATYLSTHLASHGYVVAAMDHSEVVAPELARRAGETAAARAARIDAIISSRVPDVQFLLDHVLGGDANVELDAARIGLVGHSFGGWTVLATPEVDSRVRSVVALARGGSSNHQHFIDDVEEAHEAVRAATFAPEAAWMPAAMRPVAELSSGEQAHTFVRGLTLAHFDSTLRQMEAAHRFLSSDVEADLTARGVEAFVNPNVPIN